MNKKILHTLFENQAAQAPERIAIREAQRTLTYGTLNIAANRLAHYLRSQGIGRESMVGVMIPGGGALVAALLAAFKAGGVYLPIDTAFSGKRLKQMFTLSAPEVLIIPAAQKAAILELLNGLQIPAPRLVVLDDTLSFEGADSFAATNPALINDPEDGNYLFYTSGSTGDAKAFLGCHQSLSHFIHWELKEFGITAEDKISQLSQFTFDASLRDVFLPLSCGATLCMPEPGIKSNVLQLIDWINNSGVTLVHCVPALFRLITKELLQNPQAGMFPQLKYILMAGEALYVKDIQNWRNAVGTHVEIVNLYGTSETTLAKTFYRIGEMPDNPQLAIHAGKPIDNAAVLIMNDGIPCAVNEVGNIYIRTPFMTKGYYRNEALNREVFIQNPLVDFKDTLHQTGDMGRFNADGNIEVLGRTDDQVKVNGIRVTLGEVKQGVLEVNGVQQAEIVAAENNDNGNDLLCYYTGTVTVEALRKQLAYALNENIMPAFFIQMENFPLTINGKVDRKMLPKPAAVIEDAGYEAPVNDTEKEMEAMWIELLSLPRVGRNVSFFKVGGTSLKAIQLISRVYKKYNVLIKVNDIFTHASIAQLSTFLMNKQAPATGITPVAPQPYYDVTHAQKRLWMMDQLEDAQAAYNIPGAFMLQGDLNITALEQAFLHVITRHESLRTTFTAVDGVPKFRVQEAGAQIFHIDCKDLTNDPQAMQTARYMAGQLFRTPFNLESGPLLKAMLLQVAANQHVFLFAMHHIISDGWSIQVMVKELLALYNNKNAVLPALKIQYKDYAAWLNNQANDKSWQAHRRYWLQQFEDMGPALQLLTDHPRPLAKTTNGATLEFEINETLTAGIKALARMQDVSVYMCLLATVKVLLHHYSGQDDIVTGMPVAGRVHKDLDEQLGLYVNMLAIRTRLQTENNFLQLLKNVKQTLLGAYEHQVYPFDQLVEALHLEHDTSRSPLTDVWVQHSDTPWVQAEDANLKITPFETGHTYSKVDLTVKFIETGNTMSVILEYNTDLFKESTMVQMKDNLLRLMNAILQQPEQSLTDLIAQLPRIHQHVEAHQLNVMAESISNDY